MKLFTYATSPYARKVRMALDYKGIAYEAEERCYSLDRKPDLFTASERGEVPAIVLDDGRTIADSTVVCEYLEDAHPQPPLFPRDPYDRARMRSIEDLCDRAMDAVSYGYWFGELHKQEPEGAAMKREASVEFAALLGKLERELGARDFLCGPLSIADLAAICYVPAAPLMGIGLSAFPGLAAWLVRMREIPAVKADHLRLREALSHSSDIASELVGPDGRIHWRDSRLEWPIRHGFINFIAREFNAGKMMFPPEAA